MLAPALEAEVTSATWMVRRLVMICSLRYLCFYGVLESMIQSSQSSEQHCWHGDDLPFTSCFPGPLVYAVRKFYSSVAAFGMHFVMMASTGARHHARLFVSNLVAWSIKQAVRSLLRSITSFPAA